MLDVAVAWGLDRDLALDLWVATGNDPARRLYESRGFTATGEVAAIRPGSAKTKVRMVL
jgi:ribosomal protein S18 acetylase RimI-like enzyme